MALFKILKGSSTNLSSQAIREGYCYVTTDEGKMYIDISDKERICLQTDNATHADKADTADKLSYKRLINGVEFDGSSDIYFYGTCSTAARTAAKIVTLQNGSTFVLKTGATVIVKFTNKNSASSPTLNINGTGAKPIYRYGTTAASTSDGTSGWRAGSVHMFTYDGTGWIRHFWENTNTVPSGYCATGADTAAKTATCTDYALKTNSYLQLIIKTANTSKTALTLNVNGKGAKPIYINGAASSTSNYTLPAGSYITFYNGTNYYIRTDGKLPGSIESATTANSLGSMTVGNAQRPTYFNGGVPTQTTYRMAGTNAAATTAISIENDLDTGIWYVSGTSGIYNQSDGVVIANKYSDKQITEIYQDYRTGQLAVRGKNNGTWQGWRKILDSTNYTSYTVKKDGTGASGTWGISISGNAATATNATNANYATSAGTAGSAGVASKISDITETDKASSSDTKRRIWFAYSNNVTGRPAYDDRFTIQTSTGTLFAPIFSGTLSGAIQDYNDGKLVKFGYSTAGMAQADATWLGAWDATVSGEYRLRAVKQSDLKVYSATRWTTARTLTIGATGKSVNGTANVSWTPYEMRVTRAQYNVGSNMNQVADHGCELGMANLSGTDTTVNPNGGTGWHHYINMTWTDCADNNSTTSNEWCTQIANAAGSTDLWVRSRNGSTIANGTAWAAPWTRILTGSNWTSVVDGRYVKKTGDSMSGTLRITPPYQGTASARYHSASLEIREAGGVGSAQSNIGYAPRIGFHWSNKAAASLCMNASGHFEFRGQDDASYRNITAQEFYANGWFRSYDAKGLYNETYKTHLMPNTISSHAGWRVSGAVGGYHGILIGDATTAMAIMSIDNSHQGLYTQSGTGWIIYNNNANGRIGIGTSGLSDHKVTLGGSTYADGTLTVNGQVRNAAYKGGMWISGRDNALVRTKYSTSSSSFAPVVSAKTQAGSWDLGPCNPYEDFYFSYASDANYNAGSNSTVTTVRITNAGKIYGAIWNDYAEYRSCTTTFEAGQVVCENGDDTLSLATERLQPGACIVSDTFGFAIGETDIADCPIAVAGRVLAYPYEPRESYKAGDPVCAGPGGTVSKMTREEVREYPDRMIGTVSAIPKYETWGQDNVPVNGRIWIKVV